MPASTFTMHAEGTGFLALAAADAELLVDHVHARLGVLGDRTMLAGRRALAALHAGHRTDLAAPLRSTICTQDFGRMEFLVKRLGAGTHALQAGHALRSLSSRSVFSYSISRFLFFKPANKGSHEFLAIAERKNCLLAPTLKFPLRSLYRAIAK